MGAIFSSVIGWVFRTIIIKFVLFSALYLVVTAFVSFLVSKLSFIGPAALNSALAAWSPEMWYFADLTLFSQGFPAIVSAYLLRFSIRRIPMIG